MVEHIADAQTTIVIAAIRRVIPPNVERIAVGSAPPLPVIAVVVAPIMRPSAIVAAHVAAPITAAHVTTVAVARAGTVVIADTGAVVVLPTLWTGPLRRRLSGA